MEGPDTLRIEPYYNSFKALHGEQAAATVSTHSIHQASKASKPPSPRSPSSVFGHASIRDTDSSSVQPTGNHSLHRNNSSRIGKVRHALYSYSCGAKAMADATSLTNSSRAHSRRLEHCTSGSKWEANEYDQVKLSTKGGTADEEETQDDSQKEDSGATNAKVKEERKEEADTAKQGEDESDGEGKAEKDQDTKEDEGEEEGDDIGDISTEGDTEGDEEDEEDDDDESEEEEDDDDDDDEEDDESDDDGSQSSDSDTSVAEGAVHPPIGLPGGVSPVVERSSRGHTASAQRLGTPIASASFVASSNLPPGYGMSSPRSLLQYPHSMVDPPRGYFQLSPDRRSSSGIYATYPEFSHVRLPPINSNLSFSADLEQPAFQGDPLRQSRAGYVHEQGDPSRNADRYTSSPQPLPPIGIPLQPNAYDPAIYAPRQAYAGDLPDRGHHVQAPFNPAWNSAALNPPGGPENQYSGLYGPQRVPETPAADDDNVQDASRSLRRRRSSPSSSGEYHKSRRPHLEHGREAPHPGDHHSSDGKPDTDFEYRPPNVPALPNAPISPHLVERYMRRVPRSERPRRRRRRIRNRATIEADMAAERAAAVAAAAAAAAVAPGEAFPRGEGSVWRDDVGSIPIYASTGHRELQYIHPRPAPYNALYGPQGQLIPMYPPIGPPRQQGQAQLDIVGDLMQMTKDWSPKELLSKRRIVCFDRQQNGVLIRITFRALDPEDYQEGMKAISCILREDPHEYFVTSVDCIKILELIIGIKFKVDEKNRTRRNLEAYRPLTLSKTKPETEPFFRQIMGYDAPKPRNIEKDLKVFLWSNLATALRRIVSKYFTSSDNPAASTE